MDSAFLKKHFFINRFNSFFYNILRLFFTLFLFGSMATCGDFELWVDEEEPAANSAPTASLSSSPSTVLPCSLTTVTLDGSGSEDPDNDSLSYSWDLAGPEGTAATLASAVSSSTSFTPDKPGQYTVTLTVSDGTLSATTAKAITVSSDPVAVAALGEGATVCLDNGIALDGSGSMNPEVENCGNSGLTYAWELVEGAQPDGAAATLTGETTASPTFQTDTLGQYAVTLTVQRRGDDEDTATLVFFVQTTADAGEDQDEAVRGELVTLDGSGSVYSESDTCDGTELEYLWAITESPPGAAVPVLTGSDTSAPSFTPEAYGIYVIGLTVTEPGGGAEAEDTVTVTVPIRAGDYTISLGSIADTVFGGTLQSIVQSFIPDGADLSQTMTIPSLTEIEAAGDTGYLIDDYPLEYQGTEAGTLDLIIKRQAGSVVYALSGPADIGVSLGSLSCNAVGTIFGGTMTPDSTDDTVDISATIIGVSTSGNACALAGLDAPDPFGAIVITMEGVRN